MKDHAADGTGARCEPCGRSYPHSVQSTTFDKAKVEAAVLIVQRWILARLRNQRFFSLAELNVAIRILVGELNVRLMRKLGASRREFFDTIDRPALMPLPAEPYQYAEWRRARVAPDYHVEVQGHFYSVPSRMIRQVVEVRATEATIEVFHRGTRIASHARSGVKHRHTTISEHMPSAHRRYAFWTPARLLAAAEKIGPSTVALCEAIMRTKPHPEQGFRSCLGILRMEKTYGARRIEAACSRGISIGSASYRSIASILKTGLDKAFLPDTTPDADPIHHGNILARPSYPCPPPSKLCSSPGQPASARGGSPARPATRHAAIIDPSYTIACQGCSRPLRWPAATDATRGSSRRYRGSICSSLTIGASRRSPASSVAISTKSSMIPISADRPSSPARCRSKIGTMSSPIRPSPTPSSTASSTTLTASHSMATACQRSLRSAPILTQPRKSDPNPHAGNDTPAAFVGTGGRLRSDCMVAFNRNPWPQSPESAIETAQMRDLVLNGRFGRSTTIATFLLHRIRPPV